ncbi:hypothetical protein DPEC_G00354250, partial [Dallia pectoralis]
HTDQTGADLSHCEGDLGKGEKSSGHHRHRVVGFQDAFHKNRTSISGINIRLLTAWQVVTAGVSFVTGCYSFSSRSRLYTL